MTIVIFEGCDLSGKSTAISKLSKYMNSGFVLKNSFKPKEEDVLIYYQYESILASIMTYLDRQPDELVILDRFYPSEAVYSILRDYDALKTPQIATMDGLCVNLGVKLILIDTPIEVLKKRYEKRGDEYITFEQLELIKARYESFYESTPLEKIRIDTRKKGWLVEAIKFIKGDET